MSSYLPSSINLSGGTPSKSDLAPSIVFLIAYLPLIALFIFRMARKQDRTMDLLRPGIFMLVQEGFVITRIILAEKSPNISEGLLIANMVLVLVGFVMLVASPIGMWQKYVNPHTAGKGNAHWVTMIGWAMDLAILASIALGAYAGSTTGDLVDNPSQSKLDTYKDVKLAVYVISLAITVILTSAIVATHFIYRLDVKKTGYLVVICALLIAIAVYRLASGEETDPDAAGRSKAAFWVLQVFLEWVVCALLLAISVPTWFPKVEDATSNDVEAGLYHTGSPHSQTPMNQVDAMGKPVSQYQYNNNHYGQQPPVQVDAMGKPINRPQPAYRQ